MPKLQRHQRCFGGTHQHDGERYRHHRPHQGMQPKGGLEAKLDPDGQSNNNRAQNQDHADHGAIACVMRTQVQTADVTVVADVQQTPQQFALPATRAAAGQSRVQQRRGQLATTGLAPHQ